MKLTGVITGDIVASRRLSVKSRERLYSDLRKFMVSLKVEGWLLAFEMFRGDSLQCVVKKKENVLRVALLIRAWMKSYTTDAHSARGARVNARIAAKGYFSGKQDIRLSIGIGKVDFLKIKSLAHSDGEVFHLSGHGLDGLKNTSQRMIVRTTDEKFNEIVEPSILLLDAVLEKWTNNQAETTLYKLRDLKEEEIAEKIGISQSAVNQRTKTSQWNAIEKLVTWFEKTIKDWQL